MSRLFDAAGGTVLRHPSILRALIVLAGVVLGTALLVLFVMQRKTAERLETAVEPVNVTVIEAKSLPFRLEARGYGVARPAETWLAIANVAGRVVRRHPNLEGGAFLSAGTELLALDPSRYELALAEARSELAVLAAEGALLVTEEANTAGLLVLERERLALAEREFSRIEKLAETGVISPSQLDEQRRAILAQRQAVGALENSLALLPARREMLDAQRGRASTRLAQAEHDLADTRFEAPYDLRIDEVKVDIHQFVGAGQTLFQADNLAAAEVEAHIPVSMMRRLVGGVAPADSPTESLGLTNRTDFSALDAAVEVIGVPGATWQGRVTGIASGLDPVTRTVRVVVRIDHPYRDARPPVRPPLQRGVYTRVRLSVQSPRLLVAVPASAVHGGEVYLVNDHDRLERHPVEVAFEQGDLAVISAGLAPGERVVVDDLPFALHGMLLAPRRDEELERQVATQATGAKP